MCSRRWEKWNMRWEKIRRASLEERKKRFLCILAPVNKRYSIYSSCRRRRSLRILGPHLKRYAVFLVWRLTPELVRTKRLLNT